MGAVLTPGKLTKVSRVINTAPIRDRINEIAADTSFLRQVAKHGALKARESAQKTIREVRELIGFRSF